MCSKERCEKILNERFGNERKSKAAVQGRLLAFLLCWNTYWPLPSCISVSPLSFPLFVTYTLIYSSLQLSVSVAKLFLSYSQSSVRVSLILTVVAPCCPLLPHLPEPPLFHFWKSMLHFSPFVFLTVQSRGSQTSVWVDGFFASYMSAQLSLENITSRMELNVQEKRWHVVTTETQKGSIGP